MNRINKNILAIITFAVIYTGVFGQATMQTNAITTAVPFLRVNQDGRTSAMGDAGIAASPDANSMFLNTSSMAFIEDDYGVSMSFVPWLRGIANDVYFANITGYMKIKEMQTIVASIRYSSMGNIQFTNDFGNPLE
jgi:hypothetical protein